jgi:hypothetical protein
MTFRPSGRTDLVGRVTTRQGYPVPDAAVMLGGGSPAHPDIAALTAESGEFSFLDLEPGEYTVIVTVDGHPQQQHSVHVARGEQAWAEITLD